DQLRRRQAGCAQHHEGRPRAESPRRHSRAVVIRRANRPQATAGGTTEASCGPWPEAFGLPRRRVSWVAPHATPRRSTDDRRMAVRSELHLRLPNSLGALASVIAALDDDRIRVLALCVERAGDARLLVDNPERAIAALTARHVRVETRDAIVTTVPPRSIA